jgi:phage terminase large subunit-like protein
MLRLINRGEFHHGNNPVMLWQSGNAILTRNSSDNLKPGKAHKEHKIDGIIAAMMALAMAMQARESTTSVYERRGLLTFGGNDD